MSVDGRPRLKPDPALLPHWSFAYLTDQRALYQLLPSPVRDHLLDRLMNGSVRSAVARGAIAAEFSYRGDLLTLDLSSRFASTTPPGELAQQIEAAISGGESLAAQKRNELSVEIFDEQVMQAEISEKVSRFRSTLEQLKLQLPASSVERESELRR